MEYMQVNRANGRAANELRPVKLTRGVMKHAHGSCLAEFGDTRVLCAATIEEGVPGWRKGAKAGWVTAEYAMLPASTGKRCKREHANRKGRSMEIERLIGRSLRTVVNMKALGEYTVTVDCDVIQADGGTRTASITGAGWRCTTPLPCGRGGQTRAHPAHGPGCRHFHGRRRRQHPARLGLFRGQPRRGRHEPRRHRHR